jgi:hypothetical protein
MVPPARHGPAAGGTAASGVRGGGTKTGGAAWRGGHGEHLPPAGWRLHQELRGIGHQQHPLRVPADAAGGRVVLTFDFHMMQDICKISPGSSDRGQYRVEVSPKKLRHAKFCDFSAELCIKLYIFRLNVIMYDAALTSFMKIS